MHNENETDNWNLRIAPQPNDDSGEHVIRRLCHYFCTGRERERETDRQTDRQRERDRDRERQREREREREEGLLLKPSF